MARKSLEDILATRPQVDAKTFDATTEDDIRRHAIEDGSEAVDLSKFKKRLPGQRGPGRKASKEQVTLRVDPTALAAWRASGDGWMSRAAEVLAREAPKAKRA